MNNQEIDKLIESWMNGNCNYVVDTILELDKAEALLVTIRLYQSFEDKYDQGKLYRMIES